MSETQGAPEVKKENLNRLESFTKMVGLIGGLIAVFTGIYQFGQSNVQNARDLRWKQASMAREIMTKMMADDGWKAMEMMDWDDEGQIYEINGKKVRINADCVYSSLEKDRNTDTERYIIDRLDRSFFLIAQLEVAVRSGLVRFEDVRFPFNWYAANRMCTHKKLFEDYMKTEAAPETLQFFQRLEEWRSCK